MISSPITSMLSRGQELQNPPEDHSGVLNRFLCSTGSGRLTTMPSDCNSATKPSSSRCAGSIMIFSSRTRLPTPKEAKADPMPTHQRLGTDDRESLQDRWELAIELNDKPA